MADSSKESRIVEGEIVNDPTNIALRDTSPTQERVTEIICEQLGVSREEVTQEASFIEDLGADSLDIVELVMALEEEYNTEISDEDVEKIRTVKDVITYIDSQQA